MQASHAIGKDLVSLTPVVDELPAVGFKTKKAC